MANKPAVYKMSGVAGMGTVDEDKANLEARITRVEQVTPYLTRGNSFITTTYKPLIATGVVNGQLNLTSSSGIKFEGSMAPSVVDGQFSVGATDTTHAQIYWDGTNGSTVIVIRRADGTKSTVPPNNITVSGLTANTKYQYMAFWAPDNGCGVGFATGDTGTPLIAFSPSATATLQNQGIAATGLAGREKLGIFSFTQPASGSTSPGNPGGGSNPNPGMCVMNGTDIQPLGDIGPNDWSIDIARQDDWLRIETYRGFGLCCTPLHPLYTDNGKTPAEKLKSGDWVISKLGMEKITNITPFIKGCTRHSPRMRYGHLYWANGFLSSNFKLLV